MNEKLIFADAVVACNQSIHPYCEGCNFNVSGKTEEDLIEEYGQFDAVATSDDFVCPRLFTKTSNDVPVFLRRHLQKP